MGRGLWLGWASIRAGGELEGCSAKKWWGGCTSWTVTSCVVWLRKSTSICDLRVSPQLKVNTPTMLYTRMATQWIHNREGETEDASQCNKQSLGSAGCGGDGCMERKYLNKGWDGMEGWEGRVPRARMCGHWGLVFLTLLIMAGWNHGIFVMSSELRIIHKALDSIYAQHTAVVLLTDILMLINTQVDLPTLWTDRWYLLLCPNTFPKTVLKVWLIHSGVWRRATPPFCALLIDPQMNSAVIKKSPIGTSASTLVRVVCAFL